MTFLLGLLFGFMAGFTLAIGVAGSTVPKGYAGKVENVKFPVYGRRRVR